MNLMDGRRVADEILGELEHRVAGLVECGITPTLGILLIGDDPRSAAYVRRKQRAAERIGVVVRLVTTNETNLPSPLFSKEGDQTQIQPSVEAIEEQIDDWNSDDTLHGMIIQLPLPTDMTTHELALIERVDPAKDVDGLHPVNFGRLLRGYSAITPATPRGVMTLLAAYHVQLTGARVTLIGFGKLVGRALATLLVNAGATLTIATKRTRDLAAATRDAEVVISAAGSPHLVSVDMISSDSVLVDVGLSEEDELLVGDIADEAKQKARLATPVPGGVGPMTVAMLLTNVVEAAERFANSKKLEVKSEK